MKENNLELKPADIIFFRGNLGRRITQRTPLRDYINFLKSVRVKPPYQFNFVDQSGSLIPSMTLEENILLDLPDQTFTKTLSLKAIIKKYNNPAVRSLFQELENLSALPDQVSPEEKKLAAIIKALIRKSEFIFLDEPLKHLRPSQQTLLEQAITYEANKNKRTFIIHSISMKSWEKTINKVLTRNEKQEFVLLPKSQAMGNKKSLFFNGTN